MHFPSQVPNIAKKIEAFKKDVEAKKKPPEWSEPNNDTSRNRLRTAEQLFIIMGKWVYIW